MYYTELNPEKINTDGSFEKVYIPSGGRERRLQRALLQFNNPDNRKLVIEALEEAGKPELIHTLLGM